MSLTYTIVDGEVVLIDVDRHEEEEKRHRLLLARAIMGERIFLLCENVNSCRNAYKDLVHLCKSMGLVFDGAMLREDHGVIRIGDGGIAMYVDRYPPRPGGGWDPWR